MTIATIVICIWFIGCDDLSDRGQGLRFEGPKAQQECARAAADIVAKYIVDHDLELATVSRWWFRCEPD